MTDAEPKSHPPVFALYGALRSGTTLLRLMLDAHPGLRCPGESDFLLDPIQTRNGTLRFDREKLKEERVFRATGLRAPETADGRGAFAELLDQYRGGASGPVVLVLHRHLDRLLDVLPDIGIVHLVRDPRDVARSSIGMGWAGTTWHGVGHWLETEGAWDRAQGRLSPGQVHQVRYEDLVEAPVDELTAICRFLGTDYDPAMMGYVENSTYSEIDPAMSYQWKRRQTPAEIAHVEHRVGDMLAARGYAPSGVPNRAPTAAELLGLGWKNRAGIWRKRLRRFGVVDPVLLGLGRRLKIESLRRYAKRRVDEKSVRYLK